MLSKCNRPQNIINLFIALKSDITKLQHTTRMLAREYTGQKTGYWHVLQKSKHDDHFSYHVIYSI